MPLDLEVMKIQEAIVRLQLQKRDNVAEYEDAIDGLEMELFMLYSQNHHERHRHGRM